MGKLKDIQGDHVVRTYQLARGATDTGVKPIFSARENITITGVRWIPSAAVTGNDTNNYAIAIQNRGEAGVGTTAITTTKTYATGIDSVQAAAEDLTLSATAANLNVDAGDVVALVRTENGDGLVSPEGVLEVTYKHR